MEPLAFLRDRAFWIAVVAAPIVWTVLYFLVGPSFPKSGSTIDKWGIAISVILVYPILEEIVFRGAIQGYLREKPSLLFTFPPNSLSAILPVSVPNISLANIITSVLFTSLHFLNHPPLWATLVFIPSLVFGWSRDRYGNLWACIILHVYYNAGFYLLYG